MAFKPPLFKYLKASEECFTYPAAAKKYLILARCLSQWEGRFQETCSGCG